MKSDLEKAINKLREVSSSAQLSHLFRFGTDSIEFRVEKSSNKWIWLLVGVFILAPLIHFVYSLLFRQFTWFALLLDVALMCYGFWRIYNSFIANRQIVNVNLTGRKVIVRNTFFRFSSKQDPLELEFDRIEKIDIIEVIRGPHWWQRHFRLTFQCASGEVLAYVDLCASLEQRPIARTIKRTLNLAIA